MTVGLIGEESIASDFEGDSPAAGDVAEGGTVVIGAKGVDPVAVDCCWAAAAAAVGVCAYGVLFTAVCCGCPPPAAAAGAPAEGGGGILVGLLILI